VPLTTFYTRALLSRVGLLGNSFMRRGSRFLQNFAVSDSKVSTRDVGRIRLSKMAMLFIHHLILVLVSLLSLQLGLDEVEQGRLVTTRMASVMHRSIYRFTPSSQPHLSEVHRLHFEFQVSSR